MGAAGGGLHPTMCPALAAWHYLSSVGVVLGSASQSPVTVCSSFPGGWASWEDWEMADQGPGQWPQNNPGSQGCSHMCHIPWLQSWQCGHANRSIALGPDQSCLCPSCESLLPSLWAPDSLFIKC